jgi:hypothetical protein
MRESSNRTVGSLELLAFELDKTSDAMSEEPSIDIARLICMDGRSLYSCFEDQAILQERIDESDRDLVFKSLLIAKSKLDNFANSVQKCDRTVYIKIQRSMAERIEIVRYSTIESLNEMLDEYENHLFKSLAD